VAELPQNGNHMYTSPAFESTRVSGNLMVRIMMQKPAAGGAVASWRSGFWTVLLAALIASVPLRPVYAYVDPNSIGPLYQFLFPVLVAVTSAFVGLRRRIAWLWNRLAGTRSSSIDEKSAPTDVEPGT
jgi:hypothetical protein